VAAEVLQIEPLVALEVLVAEVAAATLVAAMPAATAASA
jgi:hypothetical protein